MMYEFCSLTRSCGPTPHQLQYNPIRSDDIRMNRHTTYLFKLKFYIFDMSNQSSFRPVEWQLKQKQKEKFLNSPTIETMDIN